ncbi:MAG: NADH-quinone oxidoreductase subunit NuoN [Alphaproteobacteria bacterium]|nr:NADH-quinone oxidoreductase subunit NuoN [Alphaproteobacteria bacterium]
MTLGLPVIRPEIYLAVASLFLLLYGAYKAPKANVTLVLVSALMLALTGYLAYDGGAAPQVIFSGMFVSNAFTLFVKILIIAAAILALMLASGWLSAGEGRPFEYCVLLMLATLGMMLMVSSGTLLALYMSIELMSLALYVLAAFDRDDKKSAEAGLKYFVLGSLASGMILFGASLVYGFAGTISFDGLALLFSQSVEISRAVIVGLIFVMVGFCFKISAAPFHMWAPDVYEGAPTPVTAFFATAPKVAAFALFARILYEPFAELHLQWQQVVIAASLLSMAVGALAAIVQSNIKRLLAYSSIGHVGFLLLGIASFSPLGVQAMLVYLTLYVFMSAGMFGCVLMAGREQIKDFAGLAKTNPLLAAAISVFMFAMAGIPPMSGFFGKMLVLLAAVDAGLVWLAVAAVIASVVGAYYYIRIVKVMYFDEPAEWPMAKTSPLVVAATVICTVVTLGFFLLPSPLMVAASAAAKLVVR